MLAAVEAFATAPVSRKKVPCLNGASNEDPMLMVLLSYHAIFDGSFDYNKTVSARMVSIFRELVAGLDWNERG